MPDRIPGPNDECHCHLGLWLERQKTRYSIPSEIVRLHHDLHQTLRDADSIGRRLMTLNEQLMVQLHQWIRRRG